MATLIDAPGPNETEVTGGCWPPRDTPDYNRTEDAIKRVRENDLFFRNPNETSPNGFFADRPIIGIGTRINGGVYIGSYEREAIVVDDTKSQITRETYLNLLGRISAEAEPTEETTIKLVHELVEELLQYDVLTVDQIVGTYEADRKINLEVFIAKEAGVCRHQALLAGYLLEKLIDNEILNGTVLVNRNDIGGVGAHGWAEYRTPEGKEFVIDPAQGYCGLKADATMRSDCWRY